MASTIVAPSNTTTAQNASVDFIRPSVASMAPQYKLIADCLAGSLRVKSRGTAYLPKPNPEDTSPENSLRYDDYVKRAVFYNVTKRTLAGLLGEVFTVDANVKIPATLKAVEKDANGAGVPLIQLAALTESDVLAFGRSGLFVDYPKTDNKPVSLADQQSGDVRPNITTYKPWNIINWRTIRRGSKYFLSLVVLRETYEDETGDFGVESKIQYRVLKLVNDVYSQVIYRGDTEKSFSIVPGSDVTPNDGKGNPLNYIPFTFVGSTNNDADIDEPPLYDLADLNIAHYRNSADYEDSCYLVGQPTPVIAGLNEHWVKKVLGGKVQMGSRAALSLPEGAEMKLVQAEGNSMAYEAMQAKERQMVALGAKLVEQSTVQRTAKEAGMDQASEVSILAAVTNNVSAAYVFALECCSIFAGSTTVTEDARGTTIEFKLNTEFALADATPEEINSAINAWQKEAITYTEMRGKLRRSGLATLDDKKAKAEIEAETQAQMDFNAENGLDINGNPNDNNANA